MDDRLLEEMRAELSGWKLTAEYRESLLQRYNAEEKMIRYKKEMRRKGWYDDVKRTIKSKAESVKDWVSRFRQYSTEEDDVYDGQQHT